MYRTSLSGRQICPIARIVPLPPLAQIDVRERFEGLPDSFLESLISQRQNWMLDAFLRSDSPIVLTVVVVDGVLIPILPKGALSKTRSSIPTGVR